MSYPDTIDLAITDIAAINNKLLNKKYEIERIREENKIIINFLNENLGTNSIIKAKSYLEDSIRMVVHLIMSQPEYQLG